MAANSTPITDGSRKLYEWRRKSGLSNSHFARVIGVSPTECSKLCNARRAPTLAVACRIAASSGGSISPEDWLPEGERALTDSFTPPLVVVPKAQPARLRCESHHHAARLIRYLRAMERGPLSEPWESAKWLEEELRRHRGRYVVILLPGRPGIRFRKSGRKPEDHRQAERFLGEALYVSHDKDGASRIGNEMFNWWDVPAVERFGSRTSISITEEMWAGKLSLLEGES